MGVPAQPRLLAIMGSGETSPTMVTIHKALLARLGNGDRSAILLDTPYAFQENASEISARAQSYFARSVGLIDLAALEAEVVGRGGATVRKAGVGLVVRLGRTAAQGLADPADRLRPAVEPLIALRDTLRKDRSYAAADAIRDALIAAGVELRDSRDGTRWEAGAAR